MEIITEALKFPSDCNIILGQSHFIKTVEKALYEALVTSVRKLNLVWLFVNLRSHV